ncbi:MAG: hypothetical protein IJ068_03455 [Bacilli bacterium]|nr:hypothetical protein [Bacilli bacterium]
MYTEENEFDYNDYLDEEDNSSSKKPFIDFKFILKIIVIILLVILIIFLVFKIKNKNVENKNNKENTNSVALISDNINLIRDASRAYFFQDEHLPVELLESRDVTVKELINQKLIISIKDKDGNVCGYNTSGSTITKNKNDYELDVRLVCATSSDEKKFYYDLDGACLNCNGENYTPNNDNNEENQSSNSENINNNNLNEDNNNNNSSENNDKVCGVYSDWTTEVKNDSNLQKETRTLVKAYKNEVVYGEWGESTTTPIEASDTVDVKSFEAIDIQSKRTCSDESTTKPASRENREISSRVVTKKSTTKVCSGGKTYTKTLTKWDNSADSCKSYGIGKVVCTYTSKKTCTNKTTSKSVTYYTYCDTETVEVPITFYVSRSVSYNPIYTDYILESEIPEGYTKVNGSEIVQYRYREKCGK